MKFSHRQDILAPIDVVFEAAVDFDSHERQAMRRGIEIMRNDDLLTVQAGISWNAKFPYRGKLRLVDATLSNFEKPTGFEVHSVAGGLRADFGLELVALAKNRTRMIIGLDLRPDTMKARLFIQSLKLAKARLDRRFRQRVQQFAEETESRHSGDVPMTHQI